MNQLDIDDPELAVLIYAYIVERKKRSQHTRDINIGLEVRRRNRKPRSCWVKSWLSVESRLQYGHYTQLSVTLPHDHPDSTPRSVTFATMLWNLLRLYSTFCYASVRSVTFCYEGHALSRLENESGQSW